MSKAGHNWKHDDLAADLASHLRGGDRVVWEDMQLGPSGSPRPDVYTIPKAYSKFRPLAYEVKISVADFRRDVTAGKWQSYLRYAAGVIFAVPAGLIDKADVPLGCGLMVRSDSVWRTVKGPTLARVENLPLEAWIKLFIDGLGRVTTTVQPRQSHGWIHSAEARKLLGDDVARAMYDLSSAKHYLQYQADQLAEKQKAYRDELSDLSKKLREEAKSEAAQVDSVRASLAQALGLPATANVWQIQQAARDAAAALNVDGRLAAMERRLSHIRTALHEADETLPSLALPEIDRSLAA